MDKHAHGDAVTVEIAYALVPSALLVALALVVGTALAWVLDLDRTAWGVVGTAGFIAVAIVALARTVAVLLQARRRLVTGSIAHPARNQSCTCSVR